MSKPKSKAEPGWIPTPPADVDFPTPLSEYPSPVHGSRLNRSMVALACLEGILSAGPIAPGTAARAAVKQADAFIAVLEGREP